LDSSFPADAFSAISTLPNAAPKFLVTPLNPAPTGNPLMNYDFAGLSSVNVTDSTQ
jgi:hypothetical protein